MTRVRLPRTFNVNVARAVPSGLCLAGLSAYTWLSFRFGQGFAFTGFLYYSGGFGGSLWRVLAIHGDLHDRGCLPELLFVPPIFSFVNASENWVALRAFEFTALVISRLSQRANLRAAEAIAGRRDVERFYQTSRHILLLDNSGEPGAHVTSLIREVFELRTVQLFDARSGALHD